MKRVTIVTAVTALVALASLAGAAPAAWAVEPPSVAVAAASGLDASQPAQSATIGEVATSEPAACTAPSVQALAGLAWSCNYGAPPCFYGIQCDAWCGQAGAGLCLSGCCACRY